MKWQLAKRRAGTHKVKSRSEIARLGLKYFGKKELVGLDMDLAQLSNLEVVELCMVLL